MKQEILKAKIKERYGKIALEGNSESCCSPECCSSTEVDPQCPQLSWAMMAGH
jgi:hypothetical protein